MPAPATGAGRDAMGQVTTRRKTRRGLLPPLGTGPPGELGRDPAGSGARLRPRPRHRDHPRVRGPREVRALDGRQARVQRDDPRLHRGRHGRHRLRARSGRQSVGPVPGYGPVSLLHRPLLHPRRARGVHHHRLPQGRRPPARPATEHRAVPGSQLQPGAERKGLQGVRQDRAAGPPARKPCAASS